MIIEKITYKDFDRISTSNDYYLWHFLSEDQNLLSLRSIFDEDGKAIFNPLRIILNEIKIPYYESYTQDSIDFLNRLGIPYKKLYTQGHFAPLIIGFKKRGVIKTTLETCYCSEGVLELIESLSPSFFK